MGRRINIVDEHNNLIGTKERDQIDYTTDIYQSSALWITNSRGEVLLAQRKFTKDKDPGKWGPAVAGTIDEGETYDSNIYKEAEEEIGLTGITFVTGPLEWVAQTRRQFCQWYFTELDRPIESFTIQETEVEQLRWVNAQWLAEDVAAHPDNYISAMSQALQTINNFNHDHPRH